MIMNWKSIEKEKEHVEALALHLLETIARDQIGKRNAKEVLDTFRQLDRRYSSYVDYFRLMQHLIPLLHSNLCTEKLKQSPSSGSSREKSSTAIPSSVFFEGNNHHQNIAVYPTAGKNQCSKGHSKEGSTLCRTVAANILIEPESLPLFHEFRAHPIRCTAFRNKFVVQEEWKDEERRKTWAVRVGGMLYTGEGGKTCSSSYMHSLDWGQPPSAIQLPLAHLPTSINMSDPAKLKLSCLRKALHAPQRTKEDMSISSSMGRRDRAPFSLVSIQEIRPLCSKSCRSFVDWKTIHNSGTQIHNGLFKQNSVTSKNSMSERMCLELKEEIAAVRTLT
ncbi:hypothetical protein O6H91_12G103800 [Diphasiastrum complanatum]|uniref:Uncharacterized protein n=1 Tax=Diphasiastrum complanatum TaxID=34168 RepID=A0ACC2C5H6_DIPCM|nr:hypothetical protein O6H91_12G103800 [Diphasiastrum complanatum]